MIEEVSAELVEVRPGRLLFVKCIKVGGGGEEEEDQSSTSPEEKDDDDHDDYRMDFNVVCIHGTAASHTQYLLLWKALHELLIEPSSSSSSSNSSSPSTTTTTMKQNHHRSRFRLRHLIIWLYDGIGCGESPIALPSHINDYNDIEQVKDLYAILRTKVNTTKYPTIFIGHSYGPNWMMKLLLQYPTLAATANIVGCIFLSTGVIDNTTTNKDDDVDDDHHHVTTTTTSITKGNNNNGVIVIDDIPTTSQEQPPQTTTTTTTRATRTTIKQENCPLVNGGPMIFKLPIFFLQCLQPLMTESFLRLGFSKSTWNKIRSSSSSNDDDEIFHTIIRQARHDCNVNNMYVVQCLYRNHQWLSSEEIRTALRVIRTTTSSSSTTTTTKVSFQHLSTAENIAVNRILHLPRLVIHGSEDGIIPISCGQYLANQLDTELVVIDHASHLMMVEQPKSIATAILTFVHDHVIPHVKLRQEQEQLLQRRPSPTRVTK